MNELVILGIVALAGLLVLVWIVGLYNGLVRTRNACNESWSGIDTELTRRYNLVPNLVETVKGYARHEQTALEGVIQARNLAQANHGTPTSQAHDENVLIGGLRQLFALAEGYPELKADRHYLELQSELANTEDRLQRARRFYNANVRDLNNRLQVFPSNVVARMFDFRPAEYFEVDDPGVRAAGTVKL